MKTIVIGLGNPYLTDDGVGICVAREVQSSLLPSAIPSTTFAEASVGGLRLMEMMEGYDRAIIVDAMIDEEGAESGSFRRLSLEDLEACSGTQHTASPHDTTLPTAIAAGTRLGLTMPESVVIYGVRVSDVMEFSETPTPAVNQAIPGIASAVLTELEKNL